jgi:hypothetical protein
MLVFFCAAAAFGLDKPLSAPPKDATPIPFTVFNFDQDIPGQPPKGFTLAVSGKGPRIVWTVVQDRQAASRPNVLVPSGNAELAENFALAVVDGPMLQNGEISVRFKALSGENDQQAGMVWRYKDPQTYYAVCASSREDSCSVYRVKNGKRKLLATSLFIIVPYTWHELRVVFVNDHYTVLIDNEIVLGKKDSSFHEAGRIGLLTQGDSSIQFDDLHVSK